MLVGAWVLSSHVPSPASADCARLLAQCREFITIGKPSAQPPVLRPSACIPLQKRVRFELPRNSLRFASARTRSSISLVQSKPDRPFCDRRADGRAVNTGRLPARKRHRPGCAGSTQRDPSCNRQRRPACLAGCNRR